MIHINKLLGDGHFLSIYMKWTERQESPEVFHLWSGIGALSCAMARRFHLNRGFYTIYPNHYIVLVAESAKCRKSTAIEMSVNKLIEPVTTGKVIREKITSEFLYSHLAEQKVGDNEVVIFATELSTCIGANSVKSGLVATLTSLYTCPEKSSYYTKNSGRYDLRNVCINFLGATTVDWMATGLPPESIEGGLVGRIVFVVGNEPRHKNPWPKKEDSRDDLRNDLLNKLQHITKMPNSAFKATDKAIEMYSEWYCKIPEERDQRLQPFVGRKGDHLLKLSMCIAMGDNMKLLIDEKHMEAAIYILDKTEKKMPLAFQGAALGTGGQKNNRVLDAIRKHDGCVSRTVLLRSVYHHMTAEELTKAIETLKEAGLVSVEIGQNGKIKYKMLEGL